MHYFRFEPGLHLELDLVEQNVELFIGLGYFFGGEWDPEA
jgi:hypothetical protein